MMKTKIPGIPGFSNQVEALQIYLRKAGLQQYIPLSLRYHRVKQKRNQKRDRLRKNNRKSRFKHQKRNRKETDSGRTTGTVDSTASKTNQDKEIVTVVIKRSSNFSLDGIIILQVLSFSLGKGFTQSHSTALLFSRPSCTVVVSLRKEKKINQ